MNKLETFLKKFDLFANAPDAVAKMRELVLELAVQGKLVEQKPDDGDGHMLLSQIRDKNLLSVTKSPPEPVDSELAGLPSSWAQSKLGEVAEIIRGVTFPGSGKSETQFDGDVACLRTASVQAEIDWDDLIYISPSHVSRTDQWVALNDIMISMANSYALVGKVAIVREVPQKATFGAFLAAIRPILIEPYFLLYVLRSPWMQAAFRETSSQTTNIANISLGKMRPLPFPLPPLAEQKRIVARVGELMALCDRLEAQQKEQRTRHVALARASLARFSEVPAPAGLDLIFHPAYDIPPADLRKSIFTLAMQGKLVPPDPHDAETRMVSMEELVGRKNLKNGLSLSPVDGASEFVCLPLSAMKGSTIDCSFGKPVALTADRARPYLVKPGDIFIMRGNGSKDRVGLAGIARSCPSNVLFPDLFIRVPLPPLKIEGDYFLIAWNSPVTRVMLEHLATTTSGIWKVNQGHISECEIRLPPLPEQRRIIAKVRQLMALVDQLEEQLAVSHATAEHLIEAIVTELTSQN